MYKALTYVMVGDRKVSPGEPISEDELTQAGQTHDNIQQLVEGGAISADENAPLHPDHANVKVEQPEVLSSEQDQLVNGSDSAEGGNQNG